MVELARSQAPEVQATAGTEGRMQLPGTGIAQSASALSGLFSDLGNAASQRRLSAAQELKQQSAAVAGMAQVEDVQVQQDFAAGRSGRDIAQALVNYKGATGLDATASEAAMLREVAAYGDRIDNMVKAGRKQEAIDLVRTDVYLKYAGRYPGFAPDIAEAVGLSQTRTSLQAAITHDEKVQREAQDATFKNIVTLVDKFAGVPEDQSRESYINTFRQQVETPFLEGERAKLRRDTAVNQAEATDVTRRVAFQEFYRSNSGLEYKVLQAETNEFVLATGVPAQQRTAQLDRKATEFLQHVMTEYNLSAAEAKEKFAPHFETFKLAREAVLDVNKTEAYKAEVARQKAYVEMDWYKKHPEALRANLVVRDLGDVVGGQMAGVLFGKDTQVYKDLQKGLAESTVNDLEGRGQASGFGEDAYDVEPKVLAARAKASSAYIKDIFAKSDKLTDTTARATAVWMRDMVTSPVNKKTPAVMDNLLPVLADPRFIDVVTRGGVKAELGQSGVANLQGYLNVLDATIRTEVGKHQKDFKLDWDAEKAEIVVKPIGANTAPPESLNTVVRRANQAVRAYAHLNGDTNYLRGASILFGE